ncbi:MAG: glycosyltransferase family 4 protein [Candidatus Sumerlaeota bacterium]
MNKKHNLRILHIDTGHEWRGGQAQVLTLAKQLRKRNIQQWLLCPPGSPLFERAAEEGLPLEAFNVMNDMQPGLGRELANLALRCNSTILHAHDSHAHAAVHRALKHLPNAAAVVSRRVDFPIKTNIFSKRKYLNPRIHYLAISSGVKDVLIQGGVPEDRVMIVPSGVDPNRFSYEVAPEKAREEFDLGATTPLVGTIGSLVDHKDHANLVAAAPHVLEHVPDARFIIVGEGEERENLTKQIADLGLEEKVFLPGYRTDVETFLVGFDVFVVSSHLEGLCTSMIDAMLHRCPCVGTDTGGVPDLVKHKETGLLVPPKNPKALGEAIVTLLENHPFAEELAESARERVMQNFTAASMAEKTVQAYQRVLQNF